MTTTKITQPPQPLWTVAEHLALAEAQAPLWFAEFEDSNLAIPSSADPTTVSRLIANAPSPWLAGYVAGLYVNN